MWVNITMEDIAIILSSLQDECYPIGSDYSYNSYMQKVGDLRRKITNFVAEYEGTNPETTFELIPKREED